MFSKKLIAALSVCSFCASCTDAGRAKLTGYGGEYKVEMYSGGQLVRTWIASGKVQSENGSDGYYFNDKVTGKLIEVAGDVVITEQ